MQMSEPNQLPNRRSQLFQSAKKVKLTTNLYEIRLDKLKATFYRYAFVEEGAQETTSTMANFQALKGKSQLYDRIGYVCEFKDGFLGSMRNEETIELIEEQSQSVKVKVKLAETYTLEDLLSQKCKQKVMNSIIEPYIRKGTESCDKNCRQDYIGNHKIVLMPDFHFRLVEMKKKLYLTTNVSLNIREHCSLFTYFERYDKESLKTLLIGREVIANYDSRTVFTVVDIDFTKTPLSGCTLGGKDRTYVQFYKDKFSITIASVKQPLLIAQNKKGEENVFLVPELVSLFNAISPNEMDEKAKEKMEKKKWQLPQEQEVFALKMVKELGENEFIKKSAHNFDGLVLNAPTINIDRLPITPDEGLINFRGRILRSIEIRNWGIVYVEGRDKEADSNEIARLLYYMKGVCPQYGIKISNEPGLIPVSGDVSEWKKAISRDIEKYSNPQFLIFFLREEESTNYASLKQFSVHMKFPSQVIKRKAIEESKKPFSLVTDFLLQIQAKMGGVLWQVGSRTDLLGRKLMVGGIFLTKQKQGYSVSLVGGINAQGTQIYSYNKRGLSDYEDISFEMLTMYWAKNYVMNNKHAPDTIIIYREASEQIDDSLISNELQQIKSAIRKVGEKTKTSNYNPSISYLTLSRNHGIEVYSRAESEQKDLRLENPEPGTVIIEKNQDGNLFDFYLNAEKSYLQTSSPTKFSIVESSRIDAESLIAFTYEQCYAYPNFKGALTVPACSQYARKLSSFSASTNIQIGYEDKMNKILYFL